MYMYSTQPINLYGTKVTDLISSSAFQGNKDVNITI